MEEENCRRPESYRSKPSLVNQQCIVYEFKCNLCDANYISYTSRHLHQRIEEHKYSVIEKHPLIGETQSKADQSSGAIYRLKEMPWKV